MAASRFWVSCPPETGLKISVTCTWLPSTGSSTPALPSGAGVCQKPGALDRCAKPPHHPHHDAGRTGSTGKPSSTGSVIRHFALVFGAGLLGLLPVVDHRRI